MKVSVKSWPQNKKNLDQLSVEEFSVKVSQMGTLILQNDKTARYYSTSKRERALTFQVAVPLAESCRSVLTIVAVVC
jgi:hypothetical protein